MKKYFAALTTTALISAAPFALAASSTDLTVKGIITPEACTPNLSNGGIVDNGKISSKDLKQTNPTLIGKHTLTLTVKCDAAIPFALHSIDNRNGSAAYSSRYGLGLINGTQKLGGYSLILSNLIADGAPAQPIASYDGETNWFGENNWDPDLYMSVGAVGGDSQPIAVQDLTLDLLVETLIARADGLDLTNEVNIDGSATLELKYL
ncbi:DUF1120 domain-containing protein [Pseudomonas purpurea]|uniref:DUF1120 domain-containing protein n=1 Tax=Pseudomonas purpurea TaxID=3136737 RepID=UPI0032667065